MIRNVFGHSVQGASHKINDIPCQDNFLKKECEGDTLILAVADGHGSQACPYSEKGSRIATRVFYRTMRDLCEAYADDQEKLLTYLNREGAERTAQAIDATWKKEVVRAHKQAGHEFPVSSDCAPQKEKPQTKRPHPRTDIEQKEKEEIYRQYGTTLIGLLITPVFFFAFQLGDGDITFVDDDGVDSVVRCEKILGVETHSLCKVGAWEHAVTVVRRREACMRLPQAFMLSTDGFANSYKNDEEFEKTCLDYFAMIREHGAKAVNDNLKEWLSETSELGCGDDITLLVAYFDESQIKTECSSDDANIE